jgi:hypothetical protein
MLRDTALKSRFSRLEHLSMPNLGIPSSVRLLSMRGFLGTVLILRRPRSAVLNVAVSKDEAICVATAAGEERSRSRTDHPAVA